jgi:peroxin-5
MLRWFIRVRILIVSISVWNQLQSSDIPPPAEDMARWEAEYNQLMNSERDEFDYDYGSALNEAWKDDVTHETAIKFDDDGLPILGQYIFGKR